MTEHQSSEEGAEGLTEAEKGAMDAAVHEVARNFIVEALSWAETVKDGRLGDERAEALLDAHEGRILASRAESAEAEVTRLRAQVAEVEARLDLLIDQMCDCGDFDGHPGDCAATPIINLRAALASPTSHAQREAEVGHASAYGTPVQHPGPAPACRVCPPPDALAAEAGGE